MDSADFEEGGHFDMTLASIEGEIQSLLHKRAFLRRKVNALKDRTRTLPLETLTAIFEYACQGPFSYTNRQRRDIAGVCFRWRQVVWASPSLWTSIYLDASQIGVRNLLDLHRQNAKAAPLSVCLSTCHGPRSPLCTLFDLLRIVLTECASTIKWLSLGPLDNTVLQFIASNCISADFPHLETLKLTFQHRFPATIEGVLFPHSSQLRSMEISEPPLGIERYLPFHSLTRLMLTKPAPAQAFYILSHCPSLITFSSKGQSSRKQTEEDLNLTLEEPVTLSHLESLTWESGQLPAYATFVGNIHLPSVHRLVWLDRLDPTTNHVRNLFFSSMSEVKSLDCRYSGALLELLSALPSLETVHIRFDSFFDYLDGITNFMLHMVWKDEAGMLPRLTKLIMTFEDKNRVVSKEKLSFHDVMIQMLTSRRPEVDEGACVPLQRFTLKFDVLAVWGMWERCLVCSLKELDRKGLDVTIMQ